MVTWWQWKSKKQYAVASSNSEDKYRAMTPTTCEHFWLKKLMIIWFEIQGPVLIGCDDQASIHISAKPVFYERTKYIGSWLFEREEFFILFFITSFLFHASNQGINWPIGLICYVLETDCLISQTSWAWLITVLQLEGLSHIVVNVIFDIILVWPCVEDFGISFRVHFSGKII